VPHAFGSRLARENPKAVMFKETSAYNDIESIMSLFDAIGREVVKRGMSVPARGSTRLERM